jgi:hypothetical protein
MKIIHKYQLLNETHSINVPEGAEILSVQAQNNIPCIWMLLNPKETKFEIRTFCMRITGSCFNQERKKYIGTVQLDGGSSVMHIFEK